MAKTVKPIAIKIAVKPVKKAPKTSMPMPSPAPKPIPKVPTIKVKKTKKVMW